MIPARKRDNKDYEKQSKLRRYIDKTKYCKRQSFSIERRNDQELHYIFTGRNLQGPYVIYKFASITIPIDDQLFTYNKKNPLKQKKCFSKKYFRQLNALSHILYSQISNKRNCYSKTRNTFLLIYIVFFTNNFTHALRCIIVFTFMPVV